MITRTNAAIVARRNGHGQIRLQQRLSMGWHHTIVGTVSHNTQTHVRHVVSAHQPSYVVTCPAATPQPLTT